MKTSKYHDFDVSMPSQQLVGWALSIKFNIYFRILSKCSKNLPQWCIYVVKSEQLLKKSMASPRLMDSTSHGMEKDLFRVSLTGFFYPVEDMIDWHSFSASCSQAIKRKYTFLLPLWVFFFLLNLLQISKSYVW